MGLMINLEKFDTEQKAIVPVTGNSFQYMRKVYSVTGTVVDGWYAVRLRGNYVISASSLFIEYQREFSDIMKSNKRILRGYTYNNNIIFQNFDVGMRKSGHSIMAPLYLNNAPSFSSIEAILWEDKKLYYYKINNIDYLVYQLRSSMNDGSFERIKGLTPELKTTLLFHIVENQKIKEEQEKLKRSKEIAELRTSLRGRLILTFKRVGATLLDYVLSGKRITVNWKFEDSSINYNSVIDADTFRVIEAGYCMSGSDKDHSASSMVLLAKDYEDDGLIHITRE